MYDITPKITAYLKKMLFLKYFSKYTASNGQASVIKNRKYRSTKLLDSITAPIIRNPKLINKNLLVRLLSLKLPKRLNVLINKYKIINIIEYK